MSFKAIWDQLKTSMDALVTSWKLGSVYNYEVKIDSAMKTPCVMISPADGFEEILDTAYNQTSIPYYIRVFDQMTVSKSVVEDNIRTLADIVMEKVKDLAYFTYSSWSIVKIEYEYRRGYNEWAENYRVFELLVKFYCVENK